MYENTNFIEEGEFTKRGEFSGLGRSVELWVVEYDARGRRIAERTTKILETPLRYGG